MKISLQNSEKLMLDSSDRKVKIVCTIGPSSSSPEMISKLIEAGMSVARLNFSHGDQSTHELISKTIRDEAKKLKRNVAILQDLQGPKLRLGVLPKEGVTLSEDEQWILFPEGKKVSQFKGNHQLPVSAEIAESIAKDVKKGNRILFDDGKILSEVIDVKFPEISIKVLSGGKLTSKKGMNLPDTPLTLPCCTEKDWKDLEFGVQLNVDAIALSFVRSAQDIIQVKERLKILCKDLSPPLVFAKIEREEAIRSYESIIEVSDGILVARGDLATEIGVEKVPIVQKRLIHSCMELSVPVITATQMLESMVSSSTPTRAEASDVANAVLDGTDAVMLSAESASGKYPVEAVKIMAKIITDAEAALEQYSTYQDGLPMKGAVVDSIEFSAARVAEHIQAVAIVCLTHSGFAAKTLARFRPQIPIVAIMDREYAVRRLAFVWGVKGLLIDKIVGTDDLFGMVESKLLEFRLASRGDYIVVTAGVPTLKKGTTNMIKVHQIGATAGRKEFI